jgi:cellobiose transport system permease protein
MSQAVGPRLSFLARGRANAGRALKTGKKTYLFLIGATMLSVFPLYWMFVVASNGTEAMSRVPPAVVPGTHFAENVGKVFDTVPFIPALVNSFVVAGSIALSGVFFPRLRDSRLPSCAFEEGGLCSSS